MPNRGHRWTLHEELDAQRLDWAEFSARHAGISKNAYRIRRTALLRSQPAPRPERSRFRSFIHRLVCGG